MKSIFVFLFLIFSELAQADLKFIEGKNLNFYYIFPQGYGEIENLKISLSKKAPGPVAFEINALRPGFSIDLPFFQLEWNGEVALLEQVKELKVKSSKIVLNKAKHEALLEEVELSHELLQKMSMRKLVAFCEGLSVAQDLGVRLVEDCFQNSKMTIKEFYLPLGRVIIGDIIQGLPDQSDEDIQAVPYDVEWESKQGNFFLGAKVKLLVKSRVKIKGHWSVDREKKVLAVRLDEVKYGILPITDTVFKELKERLKGPKFEVKKPYIYYYW
jgi:hypothetical protein